MHETYRKFLSNAPQDKTFKSYAGEIRSLGELRNYLVDEGEKLFHTYADGENHFANWVEGVFGDHELAYAMRNTQTAEDTIKLLDKRISFVKLWLEFNSHKQELSGLYPYTNNFEPEHHEYETLHEFDRSQELTNKPVERQEQEVEEEVKVTLKAAVEDFSKAVKEINEPPQYRPKTDRELLNQLEQKFPHLRNKKSFFDRINPFKR